MVTCCPACGQTLPPAFDIGIRFKPSAQQLVDIVWKAGKHGIATDQLFAKLYADDPDGGPLSGMKTVHTRICYINKRLMLKGYRIQGEHMGGNTPGINGMYMLKKVSEIAKVRRYKNV